jgi:hypothetical protein
MDILCFPNTLKKLFQMLYVYIDEPNVMVKLLEPLEVVQLKK